MSVMKDFEEREFSLSKIRETDMVAFLATLGYEPAAVKKNGTDFWYLSPLRNEAEPSFHVNQVTNQWYDFAVAKGGNLIDFCLLYHRCSIRELLEKFNADLSNQYLPVFDPSLHEGKILSESKLVVTGVRDLYAYPLKNYLHERSIPVAVADQFCKEVTYEINGHSYYGIGFKNDSGGFEIRNKNYKQSSAPKDVTKLNYSSPQVNVFEGFMDFLSYQALYPPTDRNSSEFVVLNGAGMLDRALPYLDKFERVGLWLDRDATGLAYTAYALSRSSRYQDESAFYSKFKDLNDWLIHKGKVPKMRVRPSNRLLTGGR
jgi:hypothetical protein